MSWSGAVLKVCMMSQPCFRAVSTTVRSMQKFSAPSSVRKHPETFCRTFVILRSRSASLFVNGTVRSLRKSKTAVFRALNRNARLCPLSTNDGVSWSRSTIDLKHPEHKPYVFVGRFRHMIRRRSRSLCVLFVQFVNGTFLSQGRCIRRIGDLLCRISDRPVHCSKPLAVVNRINVVSARFP